MCCDCAPLAASCLLTGGTWPDIQTKPQSKEHMMLLFKAKSSCEHHWQQQSARAQTYRNFTSFSLPRNINSAFRQRAVAVVATVWQHLFWTLKLCRGSRIRMQTILSVVYWPRLFPFIDLSVLCRWRRVSFREHSKKKNGKKKYVFLLH